MPRPLVLAIVVLALSACPGAGVPLFFAEDFEGCSGTCGWAVSGTGSAAVVVTIHPGEHGLQLSGEVTVTRTFDAPITGATSISWVTDGVVDVEAGGQSGDGGAVGLTLETSTTPDVAGEFNPGGVQVDSDSTLLSLSFRHHDGSPPATVDVVRVEGWDSSTGCY